MNIIINTILKFLAFIPLKVWVTVIIAAAVVFGGYRLWSGWSRAERKAQEAISIENERRVNEAINNANAAGERSAEALENVNAVENGNYRNTNMQDAEKARCRAFPNSRGCQ